MKKITIYIVMALLCLNFKVKAQNNKAVDVTLKGIQIGQKVPDITITNLHNYRDANGNPATTAKFSDFKGKLLILDFWATWCSPCIAMIPKMDSLQKAFGDKIQFLSVTYQTEKEVLPFLEKFEKQRSKHYDLPVVTDSKDLHKLFPHVYLPHYVWIDGAGVVRAITSHEEVTAENLVRAMEQRLNIHYKKDMKIAYNQTKPLLIGGNGGNGHNLIYHTLLTGYIEGLDQGYLISDDRLPEPRRISCRNLGIAKLFAIAHGGDKYFFGLNRWAINTTQDAKLSSGRNLTGMAYQQWLAEGNGFCYEIISPRETGKMAFDIMKHDLALNFPTFKVEVVKRKTKCWVLVRTSKLDKIKTENGPVINQFTGASCKLANSTLSKFLGRLELLYLHHTYPLVDRTGYQGRVDLALTANLSSIADLNRELSKYDLQLVEGEEMTDMLSITDALAQADYSAKHRREK